MRPQPRAAEAQAARAPAAEGRASEALAKAMECALDIWDADHAPPAQGLVDVRAVADAAIQLLPQFGYRVSAIRPTATEPFLGRGRREARRDG